MQHTEDLNTFKTFLGPVANEYTDAELEQLRDEMHAMAELLLDIYLYRKRVENDRLKKASAFDAPTSQP